MTLANDSSESTRGGTFEDVLTFWFGDLGEGGMADEQHTRRWFSKDAAFDATLRERFGALHRAVAGGEHDAWLASPRGRLAYVVVLDQFSRNMFRDTVQMFAFDSQALAAAKQGVAAGIDRNLAYDERSFLYMPYMHAENLEAQDACVGLFSVWCDEQAPGKGRDRAQGALGYAEKHRAIVRRFGRFPHRNAILGRASTAEEVAFLAEPGSSF